MPLNIPVRVVCTRASTRHPSGTARSTTTVALRRSGVRPQNVTRPRAFRKATKGKRTTTTITPLGSDDDRLEELATMLRGEARSETTRQEAAEMLKAARKKW